MTPRRRDQTRFIFPLGSFDLPPRPPAPPAGPSSNQLVPTPAPAPELEPAPEVRTVYDDDQRAPDVDAEDEADPPEGE